MLHLLLSFESSGSWLVGAGVGLLLDDVALAAGAIQC